MSRFVVINTIDANVGVVCSICEECITEVVSQLTIGQILEAAFDHEDECEKQT